MVLLSKSVLWQGCLWGRYSDIGLHTRADPNLGGKAKIHKAMHAWGRGWTSWVHSLRETPILALWIVPRPVQPTQGQRSGAIHQRLPGYRSLSLLSSVLAIEMLADP